MSNADIKLRKNFTEYLIKFCKDMKLELESDGLIPTLEETIIKLEKEYEKI